MTKVQFDLQLLKPKHWPSWAAMLLWWCSVNFLPLTVQLYLGHRLGAFLYRLDIERARIARININKCFPDLDKNAQEKLVKQTLSETCAAIFETGAAWFWPNWRFRGKYRIHGLENIREYIHDAQGVVFLGVHFTTIEIGASIVNLELPISGFYRPHANPVYEYIQAFGRTRRNTQSHVIPNGDIRAMIKKLRKGAIVNYAPDQDYGRGNSVFAPFFNISTATIKTPRDLSKAGKSKIIPWTTRRNADNIYVITILPEIDTQLGENTTENATIINKFVEREVRKNPQQFLWVHKRFKTRPEGEESFYDHKL